MKRIVLCNLLCYVLIMGCTNQNKQTKIIGTADSATNIVVTDSTIQPYDIDAPISLSEIENYKNRVHTLFHQVGGKAVTEAVRRNTR